MRDASSFTRRPRSGAQLDTTTACRAALAAQTIQSLDKRERIARAQRWQRVLFAVVVALCVAFVLLDTRP